MGGLKVLHLDDDDYILSLTKIFLERSNPSLSVESVSCPEEAFQRVIEEEFVCVVSDYNMPGMNGLEFAHRVTKLRKIPIILYCGSPMDDIPEHAEFIFHDYLFKAMEPEHFERLAEKIINAVQRHFSAHPRACGVEHPVSASPLNLHE